MNINKSILSDNEGESIGFVSNYVQQYKDIEAGKRSSASHPENFKILPQTSSKNLSSVWDESTEKEVLLYYCKKLGCLDFMDLKDKSDKIAAQINRLYNAALTPSTAYDKIIKHIKQEDLFSEENNISSKYIEKKENKKLNIDLKEGNYRYVRGLIPLTPEQLDLSKFIDPEDLVFSSDDYSFFLAIDPEKEKTFNNLFNFSPKEELLYTMFNEQLDDAHKAKKLVLMSRLMDNLPDVSTVKEISQKPSPKGKNSKRN